MWRGRTDQAAGSSRREAPVALVVVVGVVVGALLSAWWSIDRSRDRSDQAVDVTSVAAVSWNVSSDRPWEGSIVRVATTQCLDGGVVNEIAGTGVIVDGTVVTNHHVVASATSVLVTTHDGVEHRVSSIGASDRIDLAALQVDDLDGGLDWAGSDRSSGTSTGLTLAGFPAGDRYEARGVSVVGTVQGWGYPDPESALHLDATVIPGESGSPIVGPDGDVVGLLYARALSDGKGLAIAATEVSGELGRLDPVPFLGC